MIRVFLALFVVVGFLILSIPILLIELIIGKFNPRAKDISSLRIIQAILRAVMFVSGTKLTVIGEENVPKDRAVLYVGNHRSFFDIVITYTRFPGVTGFIAKKELKKIPLLNFWMMYLHCLFLDRTDVKAGLRTILDGINDIKAGNSIFVFPEGTRGRSEDCTELLPFHDGSFKLATKTKCPIIPVTLNNTSAILEEHFPKVRSQHVVLEYGKPIMPSELSKEELRHISTYTRNIMVEQLKKNASLV